MLQFKYRALMADGKTIEVTADQRDVAAFECEPFGCSYNEYESRVFTATRYLAWHAAKRDGLTKLSWTQWGEQCVDVSEVKDKPDPEASDPGQSAASAES